MDSRVILTNAAPNPPAPPANPSLGFPSDGNPATNTPAGTPGAYWFYQISEEIRNVIVAFGLTPDATQVTQLAQAIAKAAASIAWSSITGVPLKTASNDAGSQDDSDTDLLSTSWFWKALSQATTSIGGNAATASRPEGGGAFITSDNIAQQSVAYAQSAGSYAGNAASSSKDIVAMSVSTSSAYNGGGGTTVVFVFLNITYRDGYSVQLAIGDIDQGSWWNLTSRGGVTSYSHN